MIRQKQLEYIRPYKILICFLYLPVWFLLVKRFIYTIWGFASLMIISNINLPHFNLYSFLSSPDYIHQDLRIIFTSHQNFDCYSINHDLDISFGTACVNLTSKIEVRAILY
jgi:hypothetical protein